MAEALVMELRKEAVQALSLVSCVCCWSWRKRVVIGWLRMPRWSDSARWCDRVLGGGDCLSCGGRVPVRSRHSNG